jgi:hypothetical protein
MNTGTTTRGDFNSERDIHDDAKREGWGPARK